MTVLFLIALCAAGIGWLLYWRERRDLNELCAKTERVCQQSAYNLARARSAEGDVQIERNERQRVERVAKELERLAAERAVELQGAAQLRLQRDAQHARDIIQVRSTAAQQLDNCATQLNAWARREVEALHKCAGLVRTSDRDCFPE